MKKTVLIVLVFVSYLTYAQDPAKETSEKKQESKFTCREAEFVPETRNIHLREDVKLETGDLYLEADSAVFDDKKQTWLAYGTKQLRFTGEAVIGKEPGNTVRYKLNDKTIHIE